MQVNDDNRAEALQTVSEKLQNGVVHFTYSTTKGEEREAFGTLKQDLMPVTTGDKFNKLTEAYGLALRTLEKVAKDVGDNKEIDLDGIEDILGTIEELYPQKPAEKKGSGRTMPETSQMYYDFVAKGFRSFVKENLIAIH